jgi:hypothetical protein
VVVVLCDRPVIEFYSQSGNVRQITGFCELFEVYRNSV